MSAAATARPPPASVVSPCTSLPAPLTSSAAPAPSIVVPHWPVVVPLESSSSLYYSFGSSSSLVYMSSSISFPSSFVLFFSSYPTASSPPSSYFLCHNSSSASPPSSSILSFLSSSSSASIPSSSSSPISNTPPFPQGTLPSSTSVSTGSTTKMRPTSTEPTPGYTAFPISTDPCIYYIPTDYPIETLTSSGYTRVYELTTVSVEFTSIWTTSLSMTCSGEAHTTAVTVTTAFDPGAVITVGALFRIESMQLNIGPIVGGAVGGIAGLVLISLFFLHVLRERRYNSDVAALFEPVRLSRIDRVASGNLPDANFVVDEEADVGGRLANTVADAGVITPYVYDPSSIDMSVHRGPIVAISAQQANTVPSVSHHTIGTSPPGSPISPMSSDAGSFSSGGRGGYAGYTNPYKTGPLPGSSRNEPNTMTSGIGGVYHPQNTNAVQLMPPRSPPIVNSNERDVVPPQASSSYPLNPVGAGMDPYPGRLQDRDAGSSLTLGSAALPPVASHSGPRFGSAVVLHQAGGGMEMRINFEGVPGEEEPASPGSPPTYADSVPEEERR